MGCNIINNSKDVLSALANARNRGLSACGEIAVKYSQDLAKVDTGRLKGSITYQVQDGDCFVGTNTEYGKYVEFGTGIYATGGGRKTPWAFEDSKGEWHMTSGARPSPFIKPAVADHAAEYNAIIKKSMENA